MNPKPLFKSRTVLLNLIAALSLLIPSDSYRALIRDNPELVLAIVTLGNVALRCITKQAVTLIPDDPFNPFGDDGHCP